MGRGKCKGEVTEVEVEIKLGEREGVYIGRRGRGDKVEEKGKNGECKIKREEVWKAWERHERKRRWRREDGVVRIRIKREEEMVVKEKR